MRVLIVCHGSINRSPLAGCLLQQLRPDLEIRTGALKWTAPRKPSLKLREWAAQNCPCILDALENHRSAPVDVTWANVIFCMDQANLTRLPRIGVELLGKVPIKDPGFLSKHDPRVNEIFQQVRTATLERSVSL